MKIGIVIRHASFPTPGDVPSYAQARAAARAAEEAGFDSIWLFDHLLFRFDPNETLGMWECWTFLAALAEATNRIELGTLVLCNPFRNPALLAKMAHTLDEVSDGRLILGVGAGWHKPEFDAFGYSFERRVDRFEEALQIMQPLLKGQSVDFVGEHYQAQNCVIAPPGPRADGIPLLVGAGGPRMLRLVARYADQWNTAWLADSGGLAERVARLHGACDDVGRDPATLAVTAGVQVAFSDLGDIDPFSEEFLTGSAEEIAEAFAAYEVAGASHLIIYLGNKDRPAFDRLAHSVQLYRSMAG